MTTVTLSLPDEAVASLQLAPDQLADELRMSAAVKLFELGRLSSGAAAQLAGIARTVFLSKLAEYGVAVFDMGEEDLKRETRLA